MMWLLGLGVIAFLYWFFIYRNGSPNFWNKAAKVPDLAYEHFVRSPNTWKTFEGELPPNYRDTVPKSDWTGPFRIFVPKLGGKQVIVFGRYPDYLESQEDFLRSVNSSTD